MNKTELKLKEIRNNFPEIFKVAKGLEEDFSSIKNIEHLYYPHFYNKHDESQPTSQLVFEYEKGHRLVLFSGLYWRVSDISIGVFIVESVDKEKVFDSDNICYPNEEDLLDIENYLTEEQKEKLEEILWDEKNEFDWLCEKLNMMDGKLHIEADINLNHLSNKDRKTIEAALDILGIKY
jgi:hypothetical protein